MPKVLWPVVIVLALIVALPAYSQERRINSTAPAVIHPQANSLQQSLPALRQKIAVLQKRNAELAARVAALEKELQLLKHSHANKDKDQIKIDFCYPVVMVNGQRSQQRHPHWHRRISLALAPNSQQTVDFGIMVAGREQKIKGRIEVFAYAQNSKGEAVVIAPLNPQEFYQNILRNGYGELTISEYVYDPTHQIGSANPPPLVKIHFGRCER